MVVVVGLDQQDRPLPLEGGDGAFEHRQLVALDVDLDEADALQLALVERLELDVDGLDLGDVVVLQRVRRLDGRAPELDLTVGAVGDAHLVRPGLPDSAHGITVTFLRANTRTACR